MLDIEKMSARELVTILKKRTPGFDLDFIAKAAGWDDFFDYTEDEALEAFVPAEPKTTDPDYFKDFMSSKTLAEETGKQLRSIQKLGAELIQQGLAHRFGRDLTYHRSAIEYINSRPETRGRKRRKS